MPAAAIPYIAVATAAVGAGVQIATAQNAAKVNAHAAQMQAEAGAKFAKEQADAEATALDATAKANADLISFNADQLKKTQRAAAAKSGMDIGDGTALDLTKQTDVLAARDVGTVLGDAARKGSLLQMNAAGKGALDMQSAIDAAKSYQTNADAASTGALFSFANSSLAIAGAYKQNQNLLQSDTLRNTNYKIQQANDNSSFFLGGGSSLLYGK